MSKIKKWFNNKIAILSLSLSNVEKDLLGQKNSGISNGSNQIQDINQGTLANSLKQGHITQEVMDLRWRTYKILRETETYQSNIIGYDDNNLPIIETKIKPRNLGLSKVKVDGFDKYKLEMVIFNEELTNSVLTSLNNQLIKINPEITNEINDDGIITTTHGTISSSEYFTSNKTERPIQIIRHTTPKFKIEDHTKKINIRDIDGKNKMIEFYVSKYANSITESLFLSEIKKVSENTFLSDLFEIDELNFITYKSLGVNDFLEFSYKSLKFDKLIEFNGYYVIKFICENIKNGEDIFEQHRMVELDDKYLNKTKKI